MTSRSTPARCCSTSRAVLVRSALVSCSAASRSWSASRWAAARWSSASAFRRRRSASISAIVRVRWSSSSPSWTTRMSSASLSAAARIAAASRSAWASELPGLRPRLGEHVLGLLLGQPQHLGGTTTEAGVRGCLVLADLLLELGVLRLQAAELVLGLVQAGDQAGLLGGGGAQVPVDRVLVVAAAADQRERGRAGGGGLRRHQRSVGAARDARWRPAGVLGRRRRAAAAPGAGAWVGLSGPWRPARLLLGDGRGSRLLLGGFDPRNHLGGLVRLGGLLVKMDRPRSSVIGSLAVGGVHRLFPRRSVSPIGGWNPKRTGVPKCRTGLIPRNSRGISPVGLL